MNKFLTFNYSSFKQVLHNHELFVEVLKKIGFNNYIQFLVKSFWFLKLFLEENFWFVVLICISFLEILRILTKHGSLKVKMVDEVVTKRLYVY